MKVLSACANGSGTSLMLLRTATKALKEMGYEVTQADHTSVSEAKGTARNYDVVFTSLPFIKMFKEVEDRGGTVIGIKNVMSKQEVEDAVKDSSLSEKFGK
ncbi:PTS sugar transporter subunit IIB [Furfurilactobacillus rossiae]|uniref:PTS sugar transporter subunit IIB n=1 Tax=Furfurilactobacillus rossiae TaxID=231049 RepID=UPI00031BD877|nr:PTS sugar transporter subunit IIB [Furfurilactobacillus rossiae]QFR67076.1 PTS ascorbate transporter subunit IIB [Furfurilactobacillus rossiae]QLE62581.1 Ascorbate-specific PTS system EIIB component [Furfurilactobacillus rossiae]